MPGADLEVAKILLPKLHLFLNALQLIWRKAGADAVMCLAGTLVGRSVEEEVVGNAVTVHRLFDLLARLFSLLHSSQSLHGTGGGEPLGRRAVGRKGENQGEERSKSGEQAGGWGRGENKEGGQTLAG